MPRPIQALPIGLLGSLGLKQMGQNPPDFLDQVRGTLELWPLYMASTAQFTASLGLAVALGNTNSTRDLTTTPPANRAWWVHGCNMYMGVQATGTITMLQARLDRVLISDPSRHECIIKTETLTNVTASAVLREWGHPLEVPPFMLLPGEAISPVYSAEAVAVATAYVSLVVRYTEFPV